MQAPPPQIPYTNWLISLDWTEEEQRTLEAYMARFPADNFDPLQRYVRIAHALPRKSIRDVALRVRWTSVQQQLKRRAMMDSLAGKKANMMAPMPPRPPMMPMAPGSTPSGGTPYLPTGTTPLAPPVDPGPPTVEGPIAQVLDANLALINQFKSNMASFKVHENTQLLVQFRDNILQIINFMETMGGVMSQMPQLPVRLNVDLANNFLPSRPVGVLSYDGGMTLLPPPQPAVNAPGMVPLNGWAPGSGMVDLASSMMMNAQQQQQQQPQSVMPSGMVPTGGAKQPMNMAAGVSPALQAPPPVIVKPGG